MHIAVSWDIAAEGARWLQINQQLIDQLAPYAHFRPVNTFHVVKTNSELDRIAIRDALTRVATLTSEKVSFVITPSMIGGFYDGQLPTDQWAHVNEITR